MKQIIIIKLIIMSSIVSQGQGLSNIFSQKSADLKSMGKQIALLQLYIGWIEKGYNIARSGLEFIGEVKQGEFNLHSLFFTSLESVNPSIKKYAKVASVIEYQLRIIKELGKIPNIKYLTPYEMDYLLTVKEHLLKDCATGLDNLVSVISDNVFQMSDDERIQKIDGIYLDMEKNWVMAKEFTEEAMMASDWRQREFGNIQSLKSLE
jgi:hypothetical protein